MLSLQQQIDALARRVADIEDDCNCTDCNGGDNSEVQFANITLSLLQTGLPVVISGITWIVEVQTGVNIYEQQFTVESSPAPTILLPIGFRYNIYPDPTDLANNNYTIDSSNDAVNQSEITGDVTVLVTVSGGGPVFT